jgi:exopolysaccharide biosynthesis polyprenyl glycosylphosphotransferase
MRISKSAHLTRLLQTQDILLAGLIYTVAFDALWLLDKLSLEDVVLHLQLTPFVLLLSFLAGIGREPRLHGVTLLSTTIWAVRLSVVVSAGLLATAYFSSFGRISGSGIGLFAVALFAVLVANRGILRFWYLTGYREHPNNYLKVVVVGSGARAQKLVERYRTESEWGVDIIAVLDPSVPARASGAYDQTAFDFAAEDAREPSPLPEVLGVEHIREILASTVVDEVVICVPRGLLNEVGEIVVACQEEGVSLKFLADVFDAPAGSIRLERMGTQPILSFEPVDHHEGMLIVKRIFDLLLTIPALIVLAPLFLIVAAAIKMESPGPAFFVQQRVGMNKRAFGLIKFRSMVQDAERQQSEIEHLNEAAGPIFKISNDPRVTRVGRFIRKTSIDELPQLINVLRGHMSLIGPRPMSLRDVGQFSVAVQRRRFSVRPGLACLREVSGRSRLSFERWLELDLEYIERWSLWLDVKILARLVPAVLKGDGAS